ncbi:betaine/proline/choline family ABC transporter ATP-binding protein [Desmospora activa]|uniref:Quaternary amine transport ATP-binding protein n=1 Tax=Desmospora activa DSM 45169 TaxID=1121389 RepID=A0A2T4Z3R9_9BACL|nr:betaine/proline/choline family ABC transporter ATP-binding protein [Desmospora activa]PTM56540.1 osmoprotectant transport system ATP-binding protein [Desmospora activa DSM 45169]
MIQFNNIEKTYNDGTVAIQDLTLEVREGELLTLIGPSGCGKTTTMRMINRLIEPTAGTITIRGEDISRLDAVELRRSIGYVIQQIGLFPHMTVEQNISLVPRLKGWKSQQYQQRVDELLQLVGLDPATFKKRYPAELSGGQQQRVGVIRALAAEPDIILMDEPFSALDPISREQLQDDIVRLQEEIQKTIVFVTHDMDEAIKISQRIAIMREGKLVQVDTPKQILHHPADDFVRDFIGENRLDVAFPQAADLMITAITTVKKSDGLSETVHTMREKQVDTLFVTDNDGTLAGQIDFSALADDAAEGKTAADIMETDIPAIAETDPLQDAAQLFEQNHRIRAIPVLRDGFLIGVVTRDSLMRSLAQWNPSGN